MFLKTVHLVFISGLLLAGSIANAKVMDAMAPAIAAPEKPVLDCLDKVRELKNIAPGKPVTLYTYVRLDSFRDPKGPKGVYDGLKQIADLIDQTVNEYTSEYGFMSDIWLVFGFGYTVKKLLVRVEENKADLIVINGSEAKNLKPELGAVVLPTNLLPDSYLATNPGLKKGIALVYNRKLMNAYGEALKCQAEKDPQQLVSTTRMIVSELIELIPEFMQILNTPPQKPAEQE